MEKHKRIVYDILPCKKRVRDCWDVKKEGDHSVIKNFSMKVQAILYGHDLAKGEQDGGGLGQLRVHVAALRRSGTMAKNPETNLLTKASPEAFNMSGAEAMDF